MLNTNMQKVNHHTTFNLPRNQHLKMSQKRKAQIENIPKFTRDHYNYPIYDNVCCCWISIGIVHGPHRLTATTTSHKSNWLSGSLAIQSNCGVISLVWHAIGIFQSILFCVSKPFPILTNSFFRRRMEQKTCRSLPFLFFSSLLFLLCFSKAAAYENYTVGDSMGWFDSLQKPTINYQKWAADKNFSLGDFLSKYPK